MHLLHCDRLRVVRLSEWTTSCSQDELELKTKSAKLPSAVVSILLLQGALSHQHSTPSAQLICLPAGMLHVAAILYKRPSQFVVVHFSIYHFRVAVHANRHITWKLFSIARKHWQENVGCLVFFYFPGPPPQHRAGLNSSPTVVPFLSKRLLFLILIMIKKKKKDEDEVGKWKPGSLLTAVCKRFLNVLEKGGLQTYFVF